MSEIIEKIKEELETNSSEEQIISRINDLIPTIKEALNNKQLQPIIG